MFGSKDYSYIQQFIDYLKMIIELILKLFGKVKGDEPTEAPQA